MREQADRRILREGEAIREGRGIGSGAKEGTSIKLGDLRHFLFLTSNLPSTVATFKTSNPCYGITCWRENGDVGIRGF